MTVIGYVTYQNNPLDPDPDLDIPVLTQALAEQGYRVELIDWQLCNAPENYDVLLIRSTWNYAQNLDSFTSWLLNASSETQVINPASVIIKNINKSYLFDLEKYGVDVISTSIISSLDDLNFESWPNSEIVFKPIIGAGARGAFVTRSEVEAFNKVKQHFQASPIPLLKQPYLTEVDTAGEIAVVCCNGDALHAVIKKPALTQGGHGDFAGNVSISEELKIFIAKIMEFEIESQPIGELFYSRIDVVPTEEGYKLMELELFEPTLFLDTNPASAKIFAASLKSHLA